MDNTKYPTGTVFGLYTVEKEVERKKSLRYFQVRCQCGIVKECRLEYLRNGRIKSCGKCGKLTHGLGQTPIYYTWHRMMSRCYNPKDASYKNYNGRNITVCKRWHDVASFAVDMGDKPPNKSLDRIDNNGDYNPKNCRWSDAKQQGNNRRTNVPLTIKGRTQTMAKWADEVGVARSFIWHRLKDGWSPEDAVFKPKRGYVEQSNECSIEDCDRPPHAKGLCHKHYLSYWKKMT